MDTLIKNVDEESWHFLKVEAAKEKKTMGELFNTIIAVYKNKQDSREQLQKILSRAPLLTKEEARNMHNKIRVYRTEYGFEG